MARPLSDEASLWLIELTVIYSVAALAALTAYGNASVLMQGRCGSAVQALQVRREASAERFYRSSCARCLGLTARHGQALGSLAYMTTVVVPCLLYTATLLGGAMIALAEGWRFQDGFMYIWQDVFSLGPYVSLQPEGVFGIVLDHYVSLVVFVITQIVLGFCGGLQIVGVVQEATSKSVSGFVRIVFLYSPISMAFVCVCQALVLTWLEGWDLQDSMGFVVGTLCNVQAGLSDESPQNVSSLFLCSQFIGITMAASGIVIQVVGCHLVVVECVTRVNDMGLAVAMATPRMWRRKAGPPAESEDTVCEEEEPERGPANTTSPTDAKQQSQPSSSQSQEELASVPASVIPRMRADSDQQHLEPQKPRLNSPPEEEDAEVHSLRLALAASQQRELQLQRELEASSERIAGFGGGAHASPQPAAEGS